MFEHHSPVFTSTAAVDRVIEEIENVVDQQHPVFTSMGVSKGLAGAALFYYYYSKYKNDVNIIEKSIAYIGNAIDGLNEDYNGDSILKDIVDIGRLLHFFRLQNVLEKDDVAFYYENFNHIIDEFLSEEIKNKNCCPVTGAIGLGNYFLHQYEVQNFESQLTPVLCLLKNLAVEDEESGGIYWVSNFEREGQFLIELGGTHGMTGKINFLLHLYENGIKPYETEELIRKSIRYILRFKEEKEGNFFPFDASRFGNENNVNLAYGDPGIGNTLYRAGKLLKDPVLQQNGIEIMANAATFRDPEAQQIRDANLLYGSAGLMSVFGHYNQLYPSPVFEETQQHWKGITTSLNHHQNEWAGFDPYFNKFDVNTPLSLSDGIIGIGIALMNQKIKQPDYGFLNYINFYAS